MFAGLGGLLGAFVGFAGQFGGFGDAAIDVFHHGGLLGGCAGDGCVQRHHLLHRFGDLLQGGAGGAGLLDTEFRIAVAFVDDLHHGLGVGLQLVDHVVNFFRGLLCALGQVAHLVRDHCKATAHFAGAGGFNRGIQGKQIGLLGDVADHVQYRGDLLGIAGQAAHVFHRSLHAVGQMSDLFDRLGDLHAAVIGAFVGVLDFLSRCIGVLRHVLHTIGNLVDRRGHQLHLFRLLAHAAQTVVADLAQLLAGAGQLAGAVAELVHDRAQVGGEGVEVGGDLRKLVPGVVVQFAGQIRFAAGDVAHGIDHGVERP